MGLSVSKKVGGAVIRNKVKRTVRESFRILVQEMFFSEESIVLKETFDVVVAAKVGAKTASFSDIYKDMGFFLNYLAGKEYRQKNK